MVEKQNIISGEHVMTQQKKAADSSDKMNEFSIALGLLDYVNPVFYTITSMTLIRNMKGLMSPLVFQIFVTGALISLIGGYVIPTGKVMVGMKIIRFRMPVGIVFFVNTGIFLSGLALAAYVLRLPALTVILIASAVIVLLAGLIHKTGKFNTSAVLIGAAGYLLIYISLIMVSIMNHMILPVFLYLLAIGLFVFLCFVGIKGNLYDPRVHWIIEICNVLCQGMVALSTFILFHVF